MDNPKINVTFNPNPSSQDLLERFISFEVSVELLEPSEIVQINRLVLERLLGDDLFEGDTSWHKAPTPTTNISYGPIKKCGKGKVKKWG